jgi:hypothetical protein
MPHGLSKHTDVTTCHNHTKTWLSSSPKAVVTGGSPGSNRSNRAPGMRIQISVMRRVVSVARVGNLVLQACSQGAVDSWIHGFVGSATNWSFGEPETLLFPNPCRRSPTRSGLSITSGRNTEDWTLRGLRLQLGLLTTLINSQCPSSLRITQSASPGPKDL